MGAGGGVAAGAGGTMLYQDYQDQQAGGYYDENGVWVVYEDAGYYDENGEWVVYEGYYDESGQYVAYDEYGYEEGGYYTESGEYVEYTETTTTETTTTESATVVENTETSGEYAASGEGMFSPVSTR